MINKTILFAIIFFVFIATACKKDEPKDPVIPNEGELITKLVYTLTPVDSGEIVQFIFNDIDGDGGVSPVITTDTLQANKVYSGSLTLSNEIANPAENITDEILDEAEEHQVFYIFSNSAITVNYSDEDANGNPLGLETTVNTSSPESSSLTITLKHEPNKSATNVSEGIIDNAGGATDVEVVFDIIVREN